MEKVKLDFHQASNVDSCTKYQMDLCSRLVRLSAYSQIYETISA